MKYSITSTLEKIQAMTARIKVIQGGTSAGKTIAILWVLLNYALTNSGKVVSIVSDTFPNLRKGAMRDFLDICKETNILEVATWNKAESTLTLPNGTIIEFFSCDMMGALGARRDVLYINEANRISWETFSQLEIRTRGSVFLDFNPVNEFWAHKELIGNSDRSDVEFLKVTYTDNEALDDVTVKAIEMRKGDGTSNWWRVYGLGEIGSLEGNVYSGWTPSQINDIRKNGRLVRYGLDFGFSNDETGLVAVYEMPEANSIGVVELVYQTSIRGSQYGQVLRDAGVDPTVLIVADAARPEIIAEIKAEGFRCVGANKDAGSVLRGIDRVASRRIWYSGSNLEKEYLTYAWRKKRSTGETLDEPQDGNDHLMDALRYAVDDLEKPRFDF